MNIWLVIGITGLITFAIRLSFIVFFDKKDYPAALQRWLRYVPAAVFAAIIFPEVFVREGSIDISYGNPRMIAGFLAALVAWRTKNVLLTILAGMVSLLIIQYLIY
jgi:branched-subunit amino acid transport protein